MSFAFSFLFLFQSTEKQHYLISHQRRVWMVSRLWTRNSYSDCQRFRSRKINKPSKTSFGSLDLVAISNTRLSEETSGSCSNYCQPGRHYGDRDEELSCLGAQDMDGSGCQLSDLDGFEFFCENDQFDVFRLGFHTAFLGVWLLGDGRFSRKSHSPPRKREQGELFSNNTSLWETNTTPCIAEKSFIWIMNRKSS